MNGLNSTNIDAFLKTFNRFYDAILRRIEFLYNSPGNHEVSILISCRDAKNENGWSDLVLRGKFVSEFVLREGRTTCHILSDGMTIKWLDGYIFVSLSSSISDPNTIEEFRQSDLYVVCKSMQWEVFPYTNTNIDMS